MPALAPDNQATPEQLEDVVLAARYGEIDEVTQFIDQFSASALLEAIDDNGNTTLHMSAANGHAGRSEETGRKKWGPDQELNRNYQTDFGWYE